MSGIPSETSHTKETDIASTYDELPVWAAPFGLRLLGAVQVRVGMTVLDVGSGTGFPLLELAQRLGRSCKVFGLDPWKHANRRALKKSRLHSITNVKIVEAKAEDMPFKDESFDLIVSNNGINNVDDSDVSLKECGRTARTGAQMILTMNLPETMKEFYYIYAETLSDLNLGTQIERMHEHILERRLPVGLARAKIESAGFRVHRADEDTFKMRFATGTALLNHSFVRLNFRERWKSILETQDRDRVFTRLERNLNDYAERFGSIDLTVPYLCLDCRRC
jgi:ubiquinone/menaquinone biosynthesis C-methylase UbiE